MKMHGDFFCFSYICICACVHVCMKVELINARQSPTLGINSEITLY